MFKLRSISARLILTISLTVAVVCGILGTFSVVQQRSLTRLALDQQLKLQYDSVMAALDYEGRAALAVSAVIANLPPVAEAVAKGERDPLMTLLQTPLAAIKPLGMPLISFQAPPATNFLRVHEPKIFGDDISARRKTVVESNQTGKPIVGVEPGRDSLGVFAMTPIMRDGRSIGVVDIGVSFGKPFVDNAKLRFGVDLAVYRFDGKAFTSIASTLGDSSVATQDELKSVFDGNVLRRDASRNGRPAALYLGQIKNYAGQPVAVIELVKDTTEYEAAAASSQRNFILGTFVILAGAAAAGVPARPRPVAPAGGDHHRDEPPLGWRYRRNHTRQRTKRRARHHGRGPRRVPPQHDRGADAARGAGGCQTSGRTGEEGAARRNGRPLRIRRQERGGCRRASDKGHAARGRRDHNQRQRNFGTGRRGGRRFRAGLGQCRHGGHRHRGTSLFRYRDRPTGHIFQRRCRRGRGQGRKNHRNGQEPRRRR